MISGQKDILVTEIPNLWHGIYRRVSEHLPGICRRRAGDVKKVDDETIQKILDESWLMSKWATFAGNDDDDDDVVDDDDVDDDDVVVVDDDDDHEPHTDNSKM